MTPKARQALVVLAHEHGGRTAVRAVTLAVDSPERFLATTKQELFEDADDWDDPDELAWCALIEELNDAGRLVEVDWKECASDVLAGLDRIGGKAAQRALRPAHAEADIDDRRTTQNALEYFGALLAVAGLALISLEKSSDSYPLMVVAAGDVARVTALARQARQKVVRWKGKVAPAPPPKRPSTHAWKSLLASYAHAKGPEPLCETVLKQLRTDLDGSLRARIRAALPTAPARDRALVEMTLALADGDPIKHAKSATDPARCLHALAYLPERPFERLAAAATLVERISAPDPRRVVAACNLWSQPAEVDAAVAKLGARRQALLARIAEAQLRRAQPGSLMIGAAAHALASVGDPSSLAAIDAARVRLAHGGLATAANRIAARAKAR